MPALFPESKSSQVRCGKEGDEPLPTGKDDPRVRDERLCKLLNCLLSEKTISQEFEKKLSELGINLEVLRKCLEEYCYDKKARLTIQPIDKGQKIASLLKPEVVTLLQRILDEAESEKRMG